MLWDLRQSYNAGLTVLTNDAPEIQPHSQLGTANKKEKKMFISKQIRKELKSYA